MKLEHQRNIDLQRTIAHYLHGQAPDLGGISAPRSPYLVVIQQLMVSSPNPMIVTDLRTNHQTGEGLALAMNCHMLLSNPEFRTPNSLRFYTMLSEFATSDEFRERTARGNYNSNKYTERLAEAMKPEFGIGVQMLRNLIRALRINGVLVANEQPEVVTHDFFQTAELFIDDLTKVKLIEKKLLAPLTCALSVGDFYKAIYQLPRRTIGTFTPYEFDFWKSFLNRWGDIPFPLTKKVLELYRDRGDINNFMRNISKTTGIPMERYLVEMYLQLLFSDFPPQVFIHSQDK